MWDTAINSAQSSMPAFAAAKLMFFMSASCG
jgi:hypothetical protein